MVEKRVGGDGLNAWISHDPRSEVTLQSAGAKAHFDQFGEAMFRVTKRLCAPIPQILESLRGVESNYWPDPRTDSRDGRDGILSVQLFPSHFSTLSDDIHLFPTSGRILPGILSL